MALPVVHPLAARESRYEANLWRHMSALAELPPEYQALEPAAVLRRMVAAKRALGDDLLVLVHNYQRDDIYRFADATGDSFQLSVHAKRTKAKHIVFAGVTFMAETADLVTEGQRNVIMPSMEASCPMAGMSEMVQVSRAWSRLAEWTDAARIVPVTYMNSYADLKAFTGENGGLICTSSNSIPAMRWAFERGDKVLFTPDRYLGHNTARWLGIPDEEIVLWNPWDPKNTGGGLTQPDIERAKVILWQGFCQVHERFKLDHVDMMRRDYPGIRIIVHPECRREVVEAADAWGSTAAIERWVAEQPSGATIAIGTEIHMVKRLAAKHQDKTIHQLCGPLCLDCNAMRQIDPRYMLWTLDELLAGNVVNRIQVDDEDRAPATLAIERMLAL